MTSTKGKVKFSVVDQIGRISFSNTDDNIIDIESLQDFLTILSSELPFEEVRALLLTGEGQKSFSKGYDGSCIRIREREFLKNIFSMGFSISRMLQSLEMPVVAAARGYALGMGLEFALSSDIILASEKTKFGIPDLKFGLPSLTGIIGEVRERYGSGAYNKIVSGEVFAAVTAKELGIVTKLFKEDEYDEGVVEYLKGLNGELFTYYKSKQNFYLRNSSFSDRMFFDIYDVSKIRMKELESFRNTL